MEGNRVEDIKNTLIPCPEYEEEKDSKETGEERKRRILYRIECHLRIHRYVFYT